MVINIAMKSLNEQSLIQGLLRREDTACKEMLQHFLPAFISYVKNKFSGQKEEAISLMHDALLDVMDNLANGKFKSEDQRSLSRYFFSIAKFKALTYFRDRWRRKQNNPVDSIDWEAELADLDGITPDIQQLQDLDQQDLEEKTTLLHCIAQLANTDQLLMTARYVDNKRWKEIAEELKISYNNARTKHSRLIDRIRKCMGNTQPKEK